MDPRPHTLASASRALATGETTSRDLVEQALAAVARDPRAFTRVHAQRARAEADAQDAQRRQGAPGSALAGLPVTIKDLFAEAGEPNPAGSRAREPGPLAQADADVVARLKAAGLVILGRTHMSEFAFTGLGLNPHRPQPPNPADPSRAPGGSSSGAAVAVGLGQGLAALGTDTGGSVRIPAAFCGLVGFKPTQSRVSREGAFPLAPSLDSVGPIAQTVEDCALIDAVIADRPMTASAPVALAGLRLFAPETLWLEDLQREVAAAFEGVLEALVAAGSQVRRGPLPALARLATLHRSGTLSNAEAFALHRRLGLLARPEAYDPNVLRRIEMGAGMSAADYLDLLEARRSMIVEVARACEDVDALVAPTTPIVAPQLDDLADAEAFARLNALALRNTSVVNFLDGCSISLPIGGAPLPVGLMLSAMGGGDGRLMAVARAIEPLAAGRHP